MDIEKIVATGLTEQQAAGYALLIEHGQITPPEAAKHLDISRTNSYKLLDKLVEMGLAHKSESTKKLVYSPANPQALSNLVSAQRNLAVSREEAVRSVLSDLLARYHTHTDQPFIQTATGRHNVAEAYRTQIQQKQPIYFLRSRMDITTMGYETMHEIRVEPSRHGIDRYAINPDVAHGVNANPATDTRSNLTRTWVREEDYDSPVEWSVSGTTVLIVLFADQPHSILIDHPIIADSFRQIWKLMDSCLRQMPYYKDLPRG